VDLLIQSRKERVGHAWNDPGIIPGSLIRSSVVGKNGLGETDVTHLLARLSVAVQLFRSLAINEADFIGSNANDRTVSLVQRDYISQP